MIASRSLACFLLLAAPAALQGAVQIASQTESGKFSSSNCTLGGLSQNGRFVVFDTSGNGLAPLDVAGHSDVFVRDMKTGVLERVSVDAIGAGGDDDSYASGISADGRRVVFVSYASNLVPGMPDGFLLYVRDRKLDKTVLASKNDAGEVANGPCWYSDISGNGRFVVFSSEATNLDPADAAGDMDVYVHDLKTEKTTLISRAFDGSLSNGHTGSVRISFNGRYVAFDADSTNLVANDQNGSKTDVFVHDRDKGTTVLVSKDAAGAQFDDYSSLRGFSADGKLVAFVGPEQLNPDSQNCDLFLSKWKSNKLIPLAIATSGFGVSTINESVSISADNRYVAFDAWTSQLVDSDDNSANDVFVLDRQTHAYRLVSKALDGTPGTGDSVQPLISGDGKFIAFQSEAADLVADDKNGAVRDVFRVKAK